jgi:Cys-tRNA(Pro)/Cys-tRNA(Cys) deacylase
VSEERALAALTGVPHRVVRHGPVSSLEEAAAARGLPVSAVVKSLVLRRGEDDYLFVLVPGGRKLSWPKLRAVLGVSRLSLPDAEDALARTGYRRGTITPFGSTTAWPVVADASLVGKEISIGAGADGVTAVLLAEDAFAALDAVVVDVTEPE